jgi:hypothetical protein
MCPGSAAGTAVQAGNYSSDITDAIRTSDGDREAVTKETAP